MIIDELVIAAKMKDFDNICAQSHKLKSSAKTVGANALATLCLNFEQAGIAMKPDQLDTMSVQLTDEFERVKQYINALG